MPDTLARHRGPQLIGSIFFALLGVLWCILSFPPFEPRGDKVNKDGRSRSTPSLSALSCGFLMSSCHFVTPFTPELRPPGSHRSVGEDVGNVIRPAARRLSPPSSRKGRSSTFTCSRKSLCVDKICLRAAFSFFFFLVVIKVFLGVFFFASYAPGLNLFFTVLKT